MIGLLRILACFAGMSRLLTCHVEKTAAVRLVDLVNVGDVGA